MLFSLSCMRRWAGLLLLALACAATAAPTSPLRFRHLAKPGSPAILSLLQDRQGFVWIGTQSGGLYRYDGYQAQRYFNDRSNPRSLPANRIYALHQDYAGNLWVGSRNGLARYNPATDDFTRYAPEGASGRSLDIKVIISDGRRGMWLATWGGLQHFDPDSGKFVRYVHDDQQPASLAHDDVNALALDERGGLWVATWPGGLDYLPAGASAFQHFRVDTPEAPDPNSNNVRALRFDQRQMLWIGTEKGAYTWRDGHPWSERRRIAAPPVRINVWYATPDDTMWAGTISAGLLRWNKDSDHPVRHVYRPNDPYSLPGDNIRAIMLDRSGMLWAGSFTDGIGLANLSSTGFERMIPHDVEVNNRNPSNLLRGIDGAPGGRMWLGSNSGFSLFDPANGEVVRLYRAEPGRKGALQSDLVFCLYQEPGGPLWLGTAAGLHRLERPDGAFSVIPLGGVASNSINTIVPGSGPWLWVGTGNGVMHYNRQTGAYREYVHRDGAPDTPAVRDSTTILQDRAGRVWIASESSGGGLDLLDPASGKFRHFRHDPREPGSLADDIVTVLFEDAGGRVWVGTDKGLNEIITGPDGAIRFRAFTAAGSVGETRVLAIRADQASNIWLSTPGGLIRMDPSTGMRNRYIDEDGVSDAFTVASSHAAPDGTLYFGGGKGMTAVHPTTVRTRSTTPQVAITDISVFNRSLKQGSGSADVKLEGSVTLPRSLTLSVQESVFSIEFTSLHFTQPERNRYAYQLEGFDRSWVQTDAEHRSATYTNLSPGHYLFKVKASNDRGVWSEQPTSLSITILPPFWQTWWFRTLAALATIGMLAVAYRWRVRILTRHQTELKKLVAARTAELEASNSKLAALSTTDGLTGIANRRGFDTALAREWGRARREGLPLALVLIDVDHFKRYNDHYGHQAGDRCLREVAQTIAACAKRPADLAARYGGEEFVLLAPGADGAHALALAQGIGAEVAARALPHEPSSHGIVTVSLGVAALVPDEGNSPELLIRLADAALYRAKQDGRNRAVLEGAGANLVVEAG